MAEQNETKISSEVFEDEIHQAVHYLKTDAFAVARLIGAAKEYGDDIEIKIRREIRPIVVELLYLVIGVPTTQEEFFSYIKKQEDEHGN